MTVDELITMLVAAKKHDPRYRALPRLAGLWARRWDITGWDLPTALDAVEWFYTGDPISAAPGVPSRVDSRPLMPDDVEAFHQLRRALA